MYHTTSEVWAELVFGQSDLGDSRRTDRLVKLTSDMASHVGSSIVKASDNPASIEGAYRFINNSSFGVHFNRLE
ncbi:MAG: transposase [Alteromonadaceae bacterium]|nr:transposase [Alteromonadaceae bacterium]